MEDVFEDALKNGEFQLWYQPKVDPSPETFWERRL